MFRIQKILMADFEDLYEPVLVENPFTQVDLEGVGLKQFHVGLTHSKIIVGCDDFDMVDLNDVYFRNRDPAIETFQLISLIPLSTCNFHFYRTKNRALMEITIVGEKKPILLEFGGYTFKNHYYNTWRERIYTVRQMDPILLANGYPPFRSYVVIPEDISCGSSVIPMTERSELPLTERKSLTATNLSCKTTI